ncbi:MAG: hypothetical protein WC647_15670 [Desulfomonilaceae bacterium]
MTEAIPGIKQAHPELFEIYGRVALTGESEKFEIDFKPLGIERYISEHSEAQFGHGICSDCMRKLYPEYADKILGGFEEDEEK